MDYTQNLNLPQFAETDRIMHGDFNDAFAAIDAALAQKADNSTVTAPQSTVPRIAFGSYTGTGVCGINTPNHLTFDFAPKLLILVSSSATSFSGTVLIQGQPYSAGIGYFGSTYASPMLRVSWDGNTVTWYTENTGREHSKEAQFNASDVDYYYAAIG